jgi:hypothetical protein
MDSMKVAASFAAFTCYLNRPTRGSSSPAEAGRYARANWKRFLPYVHEDLAEFLSGERPSPSRRQRSAWGKHSSG